MYPKTFTLLLIGLVSLFVSHIHASNEYAINDYDLNDPRQPQLKVDFDECTSFLGGSQFDYSEFTADATNFDGCSTIDLSFPGNVYRSSIPSNFHSCAPGIGNSVAMCVDAYDGCNFVPGSVKSVRFNVQVEPGVSGVGSLEGISFYEQAPQFWNIYNGETGLNNYPTVYGMRVLANGVEIYSEIGIPTNRTWGFESFDFSDNPNFTVSQSTVFNFEILPYCPVGNGETKIIWDIDELLITGHCNSIFGGFISTTDDTDICAGQPNTGVIDFTLNQSFGPFGQWVVTSEFGDILQVLNGPAADFRSFSNGIYNVYHITYESGFSGLARGNNLADLQGCYDLSNKIEIKNNVLVGGRLITDDNYAEAFLCGDDAQGNQVNTILTGAVGAQTNYLLVDGNDLILESFQGPNFNFSNYPVGTYFIVVASHNGQFFNSIPGLSLSDLYGCFELSEKLRVIKRDLEIGTISLNGATMVELCGNTAMMVEPEVVGTSGPNTRWVAISPSGFILNTFSSLPINVSNFNVSSFEIRQISFFGRLDNFAVDSNISELEGCYLFSNAITIQNTKVAGGDLEFDIDGGVTAIEVCVDDGEDEDLTVNLTGNLGSQSTYVITTPGGLILALTDDPTFSFEGVPPGECYIRHLSYEGAISGLELGADITQITGCAEFSNFIRVIRLERFACFGGCDVDGGTLELDQNLFCLSNLEGGSLTGSLEMAIGNIQNYLITNSDGLVISIHDAFPIDISQLPEGRYGVYHLSSFDDTGIEVGDNINSINHDCFDLSEPDDFSKVLNIGGSVSLADGTTSIEVCVGDTISENLMFLTTGVGMNYQYVITDDSNLIIDAIDGNSIDFNNAPPGVCRVWGVASSSTLILEAGNELIDGGNTPNNCIELSENFIEVIRADSGVICGEILCEAEGGTLSLNNATYCIGDGNPDFVDGSLVGNVGDFFQIFVTDVDSTIIATPISFPFDVETAEPGTCIVFSLSSSSNLQLEIGMPISSIQDSCFAISNGVSFTRVENFGGTVSLEGGATSIDLCVNDTIQDLLTFVTTGVGNTYQYVITDSMNVILGLPSNNMNDFSGSPAGTCRVWGIAHNSIYNQQIGQTLQLPTFPNSCFDFSENFIEVNRFDSGLICGEEECNVSGGLLSISSTSYCVGDGEEDLVNGDVVGAVGTFMQLIVTDLDSNIVGLPQSFPFDVETAGPGTCIIWNLASTEIIELELGQNINDINLPCFAFSESIQFTRTENNGGTVSLGDGITSIEMCISDMISDILVFENTGVGANYQYVITDDANNILEILTDNTFDFTNSPAGTCRVWGIAFQNPFELIVGEELVVPTTFDNCIDLSSNFIEVIRADSGLICGEELCEVDGGILALENFSFCVGDGTPDLVNGTITNGVGPSMQLIVTDADSNIVALPAGFPFDIDTAEPGTCIVWNLATLEDLDLTDGANIIEAISDLTDCYDLSNGVNVSRILNNGGTVRLIDGSVTIEICPGDNVPDELSFLTTGSGSQYQYYITDEDDVILAIPTGNSEDFDSFDMGICRVYGMAYIGNLSLMVGDTLEEPQTPGCYDLSNNFIEVIKSDNACTPCLAAIDNCTGTELGLVFNDVEAIQGSNVCIPLTVENFTDVITFQGGIMWDPSILTFTSIENIMITGLGPSFFDIDTLGGVSSFVWFDNSGGSNAQTFVDGASIFEFCFDVVGQPGDNGLIKFFDPPPPSNVDIEISTIAEPSGVSAICRRDGCVTTIADMSSTDVTVIVENTNVSDTTVCVDVTTRNFTSISGMQFTIQWDSTFMCFDSVTNLNSTIGIFMGDFNPNDGPDILRFNWFLQETTVPDNTLLYSLCYTIKENNCDSMSTVRLVDGNVPIEFASGTMEIPYVVIDGSVNYYSDGGNVRLDNGDIMTTICVGDGIDDVLVFDNSSTSDDNYQYVITDENNVILEILTSNMFNFEGSTPGTCRVWGVSHTGMFMPRVGDVLEDTAPEDCFGLSMDFVEVIREDSGPACTIVNNPSDDILVTISPNPAFDYLNYNVLQSPGTDVSIIIFNAFGEKLLESKVDLTEKSSGRINISELPEGIQFFTVISNDKMTTEKFLVLDK